MESKPGMPGSRISASQLSGSKGKLPLAKSPEIDLILMVAWMP